MYICYICFFYVINGDAWVARVMDRNACFQPLLSILQRKQVVCLYNFITEKLQLYIIVENKLINNNNSINLTKYPEKKKLMSKILNSK